MMDTVQLETSNRYFYKKVVRFGLPIALSQLLTSILAFIDTLMVSVLGNGSVTAVGVGASFFFLMIMLNFGLVSGLSIFFAQYWGSKDIKNIHKTFIVTAIASSIIVLFFFILGHFFSDFVISIYNNSGDVTDSAILQDLGAKYIKIASFSYITTAIIFVISMLMRSVEKVIFPQIITIIVVLINTVLNYLLIEGRYGFPRLEIEGAAIATVISSAIGATILILYMVFTKIEVFKIKFSLIKEISRDFIKKLFKKALPVLFNEGFWGLGMTMYLIAVGFISTDAQASYTVTNQVIGLVWTVNAGVATACAIMLGNKLGEGNLEIAKDWGNRFIKLTFVLGVILGVILFFTSGLIPKLLTELDDAVKENIRLILIVFSFYIPIKFTNAMHIVGTLRSGGDTLFSFLAEVFPLWLIGVPLAFILSIYTSLPLHIIIVIINLEEIVKFIVLNYRFFTYKWVNNLTLS